MTAAGSRRGFQELGATMQAPEEMLAGLRGMGLLGARETATGAPLTGGVSSLIWAVRLPGGRTVCVKRALAQLNVAAEWRVPTVRNTYEARWMQCAAEIVPASVPELLGQDERTGTLAMAFLPPDLYPLWKHRLRDGVADTAVAAAVAERLVRIHAATAARPELAGDFPTDDLFHALRLEPYLLAVGRAHPDRAAALERLVAVTAGTKLALVHGDVSPKNILVGPDGPVFLDAECAWWGDPAFDLAFCLTHLLLKCLWTPAARAGFLACFSALAGRYLDGVQWEPAAALETRAAALLPGLLLARVDGKSRVEYLTEAADKDVVRRAARGLLAAPAARLDAVAAVWREELR